MIKSIGAGAEGFAVFSFVFLSFCWLNCDRPCEEYGWLSKEGKIGHPYKINHIAITRPIHRHLS